jgi:hypothetical protein
MSHVFYGNKLGDCLLWNSPGYFPQKKMDAHRCPINDMACDGGSFLPTIVMTGPPVIIIHFLLHVTHQCSPAVSINQYEDNARCCWGSMQERIRLYLLYLTFATIITPMLNVISLVSHLNVDFLFYGILYIIGTTFTHLHKMLSFKTNTECRSRIQTRFFIGPSTRWW